MIFYVATTKVTDFHVTLAWTKYVENSYVSNIIANLP